MGTFPLNFSRSSTSKVTHGSDGNTSQGVGSSEPSKFCQRITTPCKRLVKRCIHSIRKKGASPKPKSFLGPTELQEQNLLANTPTPIKQPQSQAIPHGPPVDDSSNNHGSFAIGDDTVNRGKQRNEDSPVAWDEVQSVLDSARESLSSSRRAAPTCPEDIERQKEQVIRMINDLAKQQKALVIQRIDLKIKLDRAYERARLWKAEHDRIIKEFEEPRATIGVESVKVTGTGEEPSKNHQEYAQEDDQLVSQHDNEEEQVQADERQANQLDNREEVQVQETLDKGKQRVDEPELEQENYQALRNAHYQLHNRKEQLEAHLHYLLQKDSYYDQVYHDAQSVWETRGEMEQQLMKQADQFWHMRNIYSQYLRRIEQLRAGGFYLEAEIAGKLAHQAECKWARRELAAVKTELKRAKRDKQVATRGRIIKARLLRASRFNMWPIPAELRAYKVLTDSLKNEQFRLAQRFRDALETTTMQNRNDKLLQVIARNFRQELDRNEELEKERLARRHLDNRMHSWDALKSPPGVQVF